MFVVEEKIHLYTGRNKDDKKDKDDYIVDDDLDAEMFREYSD